MRVFSVPLSVPLLRTVIAALVDGRLVEGFDENARRIDELIDTHASGWSIDRLPDVDRAILRMAVYELLWADDVPDAVVIDEAVELAKTLSTDDSPGYVNGVLGAILAAEVPAP